MFEILGTSEVCSKEHRKTGKSQYLPSTSSWKAAGPMMMLGEGREQGEKVKTEEDLIWVGLYTFSL